MKIEIDEKNNIMKIEYVFTDTDTWTSEAVEYEIDLDKLVELGIANKTSYYC